jgi:hypothetical protein
MNPAHYLDRLRGRLRRPPRLQLPVYVFTHHKTGTALCRKVFSAVATEFGWQFQRLFRWTNDLPASDITHFATSLVGPRVLEQEFRGVHVVRDPRNLAVSGYAYHRRCREKWCINTNFDLTPPIDYPRVPYSTERRPDEWKHRYLVELDGRSYQEHLRRLGPEEGLLFEMRHYAYWTTEQMLGWNYDDPRILEVKLEDIATNFDAVWSEIFEHLGFNEKQCDTALAIAAHHDLSRMGPEERAAVEHASFPESADWRDHFGPVHRSEYDAHYGRAHARLGYPD